MRWLSIDPGITTGWALWDGAELLDSGQEELTQFLDMVWDSVIRVPEPALFEGVQKFVVEEFRLYPWVMENGGLDFDEVRTPRAIGALELMARQAGIEFVFQPATTKEPAIAAGARELFTHPLYENRHANDAIGHGWYHVVTTMMGRRVELPHASLVLINPDETVSA